MAEEEKVRKRFEEWFAKKYTHLGPNGATANADRSAFQEGYRLGREDGIEDAASVEIGSWNPPYTRERDTMIYGRGRHDERHAYQAAIRSLSRKSDVQNKREG